MFLVALLVGSEVDTVLRLSLRVMVDHYQKDEVSWMHYLAGWLVRFKWWLLRWQTSSLFVCLSPPPFPFICLSFLVCLFPLSPFPSPSFSLAFCLYLSLSFCLSLSFSLCLSLSICSRWLSPVGQDLLTFPTEYPPCTNSHLAC